MKSLICGTVRTRIILVLAITTALATFAFLYAQSLRNTPTKAGPQVAVQSSDNELAGQREEGKKIRTEIVRCLLEKLDSLDDISADDKKELKKILREADQYLAEAASKSVTTGGNTRSNAAVKEKKDAEKGHSKDATVKSGSSDEPQTSVVRALLRLLDEIMEDDLADNSENSDSADELRESLRQADHLLRQYLGDSSRARIEAANRKPPVPQVYNPRRKPLAEQTNR